MVEFIFTRQFAVAQFHLRINDVEETILHSITLNDAVKQRLFDKTIERLKDKGVLSDIDVENEWKKVCSYL